MLIRLTYIHRNDLKSLQQELDQGKTKRSQVKNYACDTAFQLERVELLNCTVCFFFGSTASVAAAFGNVETARSVYQIIVDAMRQGAPFLELDVCERQLKFSGEDSDTGSTRAARPPENPYTRYTSKL